MIDPNDTYEFEYGSSGLMLEEVNGIFDSLLENQFEYCDNCEYEGPLALKRDGYSCPECRYIILPLE